MIRVEGINQDGTIRTVTAVPKGPPNSQEVFWGFSSSFVPTGTERRSGLIHSRTNGSTGQEGIVQPTDTPLVVKRTQKDDRLK